MPFSILYYYLTVLFFLNIILRILSKGPIEGCQLQSDKMGRTLSEEYQSMFVMFCLNSDAIQKTAYLLNVILTC